MDNTSKTERGKQSIIQHLDDLGYFNKDETKNNVYNLEKDLNSKSCEELDSWYKNVSATNNSSNSNSIITNHSVVTVKDTLNRIQSEISKNVNSTVIRCRHNLVQEVNTVVKQFGVPIFFVLLSSHYGLSEYTDIFISWNLSDTDTIINFITKYEHDFTL